MNFVLVTQRVEHFPNRGESRDAIDQKWSELLFEAGFLPLLIPNDKAIAAAMLREFDKNIVGALLTGGNSIQSCGGDSAERDLLEMFLVDYCVDNNLPVLGVCRGMQLLMEKFNGNFRPIENQVRKQQEICINSSYVMKNSYHNWECVDIPDEFLVFAHTRSNVVKGVKHKNEKLTGIMWHPERLTPFHADDIEMIRELFKS